MHSFSLEASCISHKALPRHHPRKFHQRTIRTLPELLRTVCATNIDHAVKTFSGRIRGTGRLSAASICLQRVGESGSNGRDAGKRRRETATSKANGSYHVRREPLAGAIERRTAKYAGLARSRPRSMRNPCDEAFRVVGRISKTDVGYRTLREDFLSQQ